MNTVRRIWRASFTHRWHTNYDLCDTRDPVHGHQGRVVLLVLGLFPQASRQLLVAAATHDQGECKAGDGPYDAKKEYPGYKEILDTIEADELYDQGLDYQADLWPEDKDRLRLCDWLDAWLWMMRHARHLYARSDWQAQLRDTRRLAETLGVGAEVDGLIDEEVNVR